MKKSYASAIWFSIMSLVGCSSNPTNANLDLSQINSKDAAKALVSEGKLAKVYMFPLELGGIDAEINVLYVTHKAAAEKEKIDAEILALAQEGKIKKYECNPNYLTKSFVPNSLQIIAVGDRQYSYSVQVF